MSNVHYSYHVDPDEKGRVVTIARELEGNNIVFGFSVCQPPKWVTVVDQRHVVMREKVDGDVFNKKKGRTLALGRMVKRPFVICRPEGSTTHPLDEIRKLFATRQVSLRHPLTGKEYPAPDFIVRAVVEGPSLKESAPPSTRVSLSDHKLAFNVSSPSAVGS